MAGGPAQHGGSGGSHGGSHEKGDHSEEEDKPAMDKNIVAGIAERVADMHKREHDMDYFKALLEKIDHRIEDMQAHLSSALMRPRPESGNAQVESSWGSAPQSANESTARSKKHENTATSNPCENGAMGKVADIDAASERACNNAPLSDAPGQAVYEADPAEEKCLAVVQPSPVEASEIQLKMENEALPAEESKVPKTSKKLQIRRAVWSLHGHHSRAVRNHVEDEPDGIYGHNGDFLPDPNQEVLKARKRIIQGLDVAELYDLTGCCAKIVLHPAFEMVAACVIVLNALYIAIDIEYNTEDADVVTKRFFAVAEMAFYTYFALEWLVRFFAFERKRYACQDHWFIFDTVVVGFGTMEVIFHFTDSNRLDGAPALLRLFRLAKLIKISRLVRFLRCFPELVVLLKGLSMATRSVLSAILVLLVFTYIFALIFLQLTEGQEVGEEYFDNVSQSIVTLLLRCICQEELITLISDLGNERIALALLAITYFSFSSLALLNMLIGILCEIISIVSQEETACFQASFVKATISEAFKECGHKVRKDTIITKDMFYQLLTEPAASRMVRSSGVDPVGLLDVEDFMFNGFGNRENTEKNSSASLPESNLTFGQFVELVLEYGERNSATVKDIVDSRKVLITKLDDLEAKLDWRLDGKFDQFDRRIKGKLDETEAILEETITEAKRDELQVRAQPLHEENHV
jgi:hypothetical protein